LRIACAKEVLPGVETKAVVIKMTIEHDHGIMLKLIVINGAIVII